MRQPWQRLAIGLTVLVIAASPAAGQFDPSCWEEQRKKLEEQVRRMDPETQRRHGGLMAEGRREAERTLKDGHALSERLQKERHEAMHQAQAADPAGQRARAALQQQWQNVNVKDPASVRAAQKETERVTAQTNTSALAQAVKAPNVDAAQGATTAFQKIANHKEAEFQVRRQLAGVGGEHREAAVARTVATAAQALGLTPEAAARLQQNRAYADALSAFALTTMVGKNGQIAEDVEAAVGLAKTPFDSARKVSAVVAAKQLDASMTLSQIGGQWGGDRTLVDVRDKLGTQTRQALTTSAARALGNYDQVTQAQRLMRDVAKIVVPAPTQDVDKTVRTIGAAVEDTTRKVEQLIRGNPFVPKE